MNTEKLRQACAGLDNLLIKRPTLAPLVERLLENGLQGSVLRYLKDADEDSLLRFLEDFDSLDLARISAHREALGRGSAESLGPEDVAPVALVTLEQQDERQKDDAAAGRQALTQGRFASVAFAGGAGTRFFSGLDELQNALTRPNLALRHGQFASSEPKGVFPISPVLGLSFYALIIGEALRAGIQSGRLPWVLLLTSRVTHARTLHFLRSADLWGLPAGAWLAFMQADEPRLDMEGDLAVVDDGRLAWTGDGHGGVYRALLSAGPDGRSLRDALAADGVEHLVMHNVDNAAARPFAPARLGFHLREGSRFTVSATRKVDPTEKVGLLMHMRATDRVEVVEYNVLAPEIAELRDSDTGRLVHEAGNINTNLVALDAIDARIDNTLYTGKTIETRLGPVETSSLEMLNQHLTRRLSADRVRAYEVKREEFFMPTKNVKGVDSVVSTTRMMSDRFARNLRRAGAQVHEEALCDLGPACGDGAQDLKRSGLGAGWSLAQGARLFACVCPPRDGEEPPCGSDLRLEADASLILRSRRPYGHLQLGPDRALLQEPAGRSRIRIGKNLIVRPGISVHLDVGPGASLKIRDGAEFHEDLHIEVPQGESLQIP